MKAVIFRTGQYWGYEILDGNIVTYTEDGFEMKEDAKAAARILHPGIFLLVAK